MVQYQSQNIKSILWKIRKQMRHFGTGDTVETETFKAALTQLLNAVIAQKGFLFYWFFCNCSVLLLCLCNEAARNST